jgi:hypothetical protein
MERALTHPSLDSFITAAASRSIVSFGPKLLGQAVSPSGVMEEARGVIIWFNILRPLERRRVVLLRSAS